MLQDGLGSNKAMRDSHWATPLVRISPRRGNLFASPSFNDHRILWKPNTIEEFANAVKGFIAAFPDQHYTFQYIVAGELYGYSSGQLCWRSSTGRKFSGGSSISFISKIVGP